MTIFLPRLSRTSRLLVPFLILLFILQCAWFIATQSLTNDEPEHIVAGVEAWRFGEFERWHDQPPLARLLFALPMLGQNLSYSAANGGIHPLAPAPLVWQYRARAMNVLLGIALLLLLWNTARRLFSAAAANFVLALAVFSPDFIAHFSLATIDGAGALFLFAAVVQFMRWRRRPSRPQAVLLGAVLGCMLLSKFNSPPLFALILALVLVLIPEEGINWRPRSWRWGQAALALMAACAVVWAGYFFHISRVTFAGQMVTIHFAGYTQILRYEMPTLAVPVTVFLPACEWLTGLGMVMVHNLEGHRSFLLGHYSAAGFKLYFPAAILFKWPLIVLLLGAAGVFLAFRKVETYRELLWMGIFPAVYFAFAVLARIDIGVRHVLPVYPFLLLYAGCVWEWAHGVRWAKPALGILLLVQAADIARYAPDYLAYFNLLVRPGQTWRILSDSNTDWGQGMLALRKYQTEHPGEVLHLAYVGEVDPVTYGVRYVPLREEDRPSGTVVVSSTHLSGQLLKNHYAYRWLLQYPVKAVLDHALYVFEVPENGGKPQP